MLPIPHCAVMFPQASYQSMLLSHGSCLFLLFIFVIALAYLYVQCGYRLPFSSWQPAAEGFWGLQGPFAHSFNRERGLPANPGARRVAVPGINAVLVNRKASVQETLGVELVAAVAPWGMSVGCPCPFGEGMQ